MKVRIEYNDETAAKKARTVKRYDRATLESPTKTSEGFMRGQGLLTRTGVFDYYVQDGDQVIKVRELRPPEEVFAEESLRSFSLVPLTLDHPPENLTPETVKGYQVGAVGMPDVVEDHVRADLLITEKDAIQAVEAGKNQLSCGYVCQTDFRSGVYTDAQGVRHDFDVVQRNIRGNHVAIVDQGRAGASSAIRLDSGDGVIAYADAQKTKGKTMKIKVADQEYEVPDEVGKRMTALEEVAKKASDAASGSSGGSDSDASTSTGAAGGDSVSDAPKEGGDKPASGGDELMALKGRIAALEAAMADQKKSDAADKLRLIKREAAGVLGVEESKLDGKDLVAVQKEVIAKVLPSMRLDSDDPTYIGAIYSTALQVRTNGVGTQNGGQRVDTNEDLGKALNEARDGQDRQDKNPMVEAHQRYVDRMSNRWKSPKLLEAEKRARG